MTLAETMERLWTVPPAQQAAALFEWFADGDIDAEVYCEAVELLEDADAAGAIGLRRPA